MKFRADARQQRARVDIGLLYVLLNYIIASIRIIPTKSGNQIEECVTL